jgi:hypothetical protein
MLAAAKVTSLIARCHQGLAFFVPFSGCVTAGWQGPKSPMIRNLLILLRLRAKLVPFVTSTYAPGNSPDRKRPRLQLCGVLIDDHNKALAPRQGPASASSVLLWVTGPAPHNPLRHRPAVQPGAAVPVHLDPGQRRRRAGGVSGPSPSGRDV